MPYHSPESVGLDRFVPDAPNRRISAKMGHIHTAGCSIISVMSGGRCILGRQLSAVKQR
jgi:hypothetical protein